MSIKQGNNYIAGGGGTGAWGSITGTLSDQTDLQNTLDTKANTSLSNLNSQGKNIANWSNNVTNCITEIPQDIKLELNNGTLTLKAGSKVYVPNGFEQDGTTPKFDVIIIVEDTSMDTWGSVTSYCMITRIPEGIIIPESPFNIYSGSTAPSGTTYMWWYDTVNNIVKRTADGGSTWISGSSLPLCYCYADNGAISSIDQIFNGFGYIGSTIFALPGVKGLIPNGRNADGTLKNIESTLTKVHTYWLDSAWGTVLNGYKFYLRVFDEVQGGYAGDVQPDTRVIYSKGIPSSTYTGVYYDTEENKWFLVENGVVIAQDKMFLGISFIANITATTFTVDGNWSPKTAFHALDYNDSSTIAGWSMPSSRYIDLTIGASGSTYTAPANGWFWIGGLTDTVQAVTRYVMRRTSDRFGIGFGNQGLPTTGGWVGGIVPVKKGDVVGIYYVNNTADIAMRFFYTEGEN